MTLTVEKNITIVPDNKKIKTSPHMYKCFQKFWAFENIQHKSHTINIQIISTLVLNKGEK